MDRDWGVADQAELRKVMLAESEVGEWVQVERRRSERRKSDR